MCQFNSFSYFFTPSLITKCTRIVCLIRKTIFVKLIYITASIDLTKHFMKHIGMPPYINFQNFFKSMIFINKHLSKYSTRFGIFSFIRQDFWNTLFAITTCTKRIVEVECEKWSLTYCDDNHDNNVLKMHAMIKVKKKREKEITRDDRMWLLPFTNVKRHYLRILIAWSINYRIIKFYWFIISFCILFFLTKNSKCLQIAFFHVQELCVNIHTIS